MATKTFDQNHPGKLPAVRPADPLHDIYDRLGALDVLRGLAVAGMILVTDPGTYQAVYPQLLHAQWNGATATDMIFPGFLFSVGVAITLSFRSRLGHGESVSSLAKHVLVRSVVLFLIGLALNGFPDYNWQTLRIPGVLQRIALCYLGASLIWLGSYGVDRTLEGSSRSRRIAMLVAAILVIYWGALKFVPTPGFGANRLDSLGYLGGYIDRAIFGVHHLWPYGLTPGVGVTYDPEGILSTFPAIATTLMGLLAGDFLRTQQTLRAKAARLAAAGLILFIAGLLLHPFFPINKRMWTSTFVLVSGGVALITFAGLLYSVDGKNWKRWTLPLTVFGSNAILAFTLSNLITVMMDRIHVGAELHAPTIHQWANTHLFQSWLPQEIASLGYAITVVLVNLAFLSPLYRKRVFVRI